MSDGPYKSLPMKRAWKDVCERAYVESYSEQERAESMCVAFHSDFRRDVGTEYLKAIANVLVDQAQGNLLSNQARAEIDALRYRYTQSPLRDALTEHIQGSLHDGFAGEAAVAEGVRRTTQDHGLSSIRQVEEHVKRDAKNPSELRKSESVRENLVRTLSSSQVANFGNEIVSQMKGDPVRTKLEKASGLDDGPEAP